MNAAGAFGWISEFNLPARIKFELLALWHSAKRLVIAILRYLAEHRHICHGLIVGAFLAWALHFVPIIGGFLGLLCMALCVSASIVQDMQDQFARTFADVTV